MDPAFWTEEVEEQEETEVIGDTLMDECFLKLGILWQLVRRGSSVSQSCWRAFRDEGSDARVSAGTKATEGTNMSVD